MSHDGCNMAPQSVVGGGRTPNTHHPAGTHNDKAMMITKTIKGSRKLKMRDMIALMAHAEWRYMY